MKFSEYYIFGVKVTDISRDEWRNYLYNKFHHNEYARMIILTEKKLFQALFNKELLETINKADIVLCSSSLIAWFTYHLHDKIIKPVLPTTYVLDALTVASEHQATVSFFGSTKKNIFKTVKKASQSFSGIKIVNHYAADIPLKEQGRVFIALRKSAAKLGLFNLGNSKKQELWINKNYEIFKQGVVMGTDDAFEVIAGEKKVPSLAMQNKGWLGFHTMLTNPFNIAKLGRFFILVLYYAFYKFMDHKK